MQNSLFNPYFNATKDILPEGSLWFFDQGLRLGGGGLIGHAACSGQDSDRLEALLAIAFRRRLPAHQLRHVSEAAAHSRRGDQVLANLRLALAGLTRIPVSQNLQKRFAMADTLLANGMTAPDLLRALDLDAMPSGRLVKFDPDQLRVPAGHGPESGRWAGDAEMSGPSVAARASPIALRAAPLLAPELGAITMGALTALAGTVGFAAVAGVLFVPWQNAISSSGPLPGKSGTSYIYDHDEGLLRVLDPAGQILAAGHKDGSGVFFDADTGVPFARELNGALLFDDAAAVAGGDPEAGIVPRAFVDDDEPKLCPEPGPDQPGSEAASKQAKEYQEQISRMINPERPLEYGLAMSLINPFTGNIVHYDECDEKTGTMIEAKAASFDGLLQFEPAVTNVTNQWLDQSAREVAAAGTRRVEWYFAEQYAADYASKLFAKRDKGRERIVVKWQAAEKS